MDINKAKCKHFYTELVKQQLQRNTCIDKWMKHFNCQIKFPDLYHNKLQHNYEVKLADFNFKLLNGLLPTGSNLFKWKKRETAQCIYCSYAVHDECHMLHDCKEVLIVWNQLSKILKIQIDFQIIVTGIPAEIDQNKIITLICFLIYKKYIRDINDNDSLTLKAYLKKELQICLEIYSGLRKGSALTNIKSFIDGL